MQTNINQRDSEGRKQGYWRFSYTTNPKEPLEEAFYLDDIRHGPYRLFGLDGREIISGTYVYGKRAGLWIHNFILGSSVISFYAD